MKDKNEQLFYQSLENIFTGAKVEGEGGYINLLKIKSSYYKKILDVFKEEVDNEPILDNPDFKEEFFERLFSFFEKYFSESGSVYFVKTANWQRVYEKVYTDNKDVVLFWKTHMLYYVKSDILFNSMNVEVENEETGISHKFYFDVGELKNKQNNEKKELVFTYKDTQKNIHNFEVAYSEKGNKTKLDEISKKIKINVEILKKACNTFRKQSEVDFFINKNAEKFLTEQLDLYLHQILLEEKNIFDQNRLDQLKTVKTFAIKIIQFISQFEDELVRIWNKPKFVLNSNYVITLDKLDDKIIRKIATHKNLKVQIGEWQALGMVEKGFDFSKLENDDLIKSKNEQYQHLPIDTKYFKDLEIEILSLFDNLDEALDGRLIHSENYQALNTLKDKYKGKVKFIHIDPPYNAKHSEIYYTNTYKSASWLSFMRDRIELSLKYLMQNSCYMCHIDEYEYEKLKLLFDSYDLENIGTAIWDKRNPMGGSNQIANQHEYIICRTQGTLKLQAKKENGKTILNKAKELIKENNNAVDDTVRKNFKKWVKSQEDFSGGESAFCEIDNEGKVYRTTHMGAPEQRTDDKYFIPLIHPITKKPCPVPASGWSNTPDFMEELIKNNEIIFGKDEKKQPERVSFLTDKLIGEFSSLIYDGSKGKRDSNSLGFDFQYNHPVKLYEKLLFSVDVKDNEYILDYFGGSGTTVHSVLNLNKQDKIKRKYLLFELGEHFFNAILPRIKKVCYSDKWEKGKAQGGQGITQFFKYSALEQYEQTLDNMTYDVTNQDLFNQKNPFEEYIFYADKKFAHVLELKKNKLDLNFDNLYKNIDFPETISNLLGLPIKKITTQEVILQDGKEERIINYDYKNMNDDKKLEFIRLLQPLLWWGK